MTPAQLEPYGHDNISTHTLTWSVTLAKPKTIEGVEISTHTLTWSVTYYRGEILLDIPISTHTLTWSVTVCGAGLGCKLSFQLTRSRGA